MATSTNYLKKVNASLHKMPIDEIGYQYRLRNLLSGFKFLNDEIIELCKKRALVSGNFDDK